MVRKFSGSVEDVFLKQLQLLAIKPDDFKLAGYVANKTQINKDTSRSPLVSFNHTFQDFSNEWQNKEAYRRYYAQGVADGQLGLYTYLEYANIEAKKPHKDFFEQEAASAWWYSNKLQLHFAYYDDQNIPCSLVLVLNKEQPKDWTLQVFRNLNKPLAERTTTLFIEGDLLMPKQALPHATDIKDLNLALQEAIGSANVHQLLSGALDKNNIEIEKFTQLKNRIHVSRNIDDRDSKSILLEELFSITGPKLKENEQLKKSIDLLRDCAENDIDFYYNFYEKIEAFEKQFPEFILTTYAIKLELRAHQEKNKSNTNIYLEKAYSSQAQILRKLRDASNNSEHTLKNDVFEGLNPQTLRKTLAEISFSELENEVKKKCEQERFKAVVNFEEKLPKALQQDAELAQLISFYKEKHLANPYDNNPPKFNAFAEESSVLRQQKKEQKGEPLRQKIRSYASQLESIASSLQEDTKTNVCFKTALLKKKEELIILTQSENILELWEHNNNPTFYDLAVETLENARAAEKNKLKAKNYLSYGEELKKLAEELPQTAKHPQNANLIIELYRIGLLQEAESLAKDNEEVSKKIANDENLQQYSKRNFFEIVKDWGIAKVYSEDIQEVNQSIIDEQLQQLQHLKPKALPRPLEPKSPAKQSFFSRNYKEIIAGIISLFFIALAVTSLALTLTGVLAPLGIALGAATTAGGFWLTASAATIGIAAVMNIFSKSLKIVANEEEYASKLRKYDKQMESYNRQLNTITAEEKKQWESYNNHLKEEEEKLLTEHKKVVSLILEKAAESKIDEGVKKEISELEKLFNEQMDLLIPKIEEAELKLNQLQQNVEELVKKEASKFQKSLITKVQEFQQAVHSAETIQPEVPKRAENPLEQGKNVEEPNQINVQISQ